MRFKNNIKKKHNLNFTESHVKRFEIKKLKQINQNYFFFYRL